MERPAEAEERLLFLTVQRQDIVEGIAATEEALREIKRRSRERFRHAFEQINKNFSTLFQELFGGGRGEMSLIDADDVLESGIDVVAQPPGKRPPENLRHEMPRQQRAPKRLDRRHAVSSITANG